MGLAPRFYQVASLQELVERGLARLEAALPGETVADPPLAFGQTDLSGRALEQHPGGTDWRANAGGVQANPIATYVLDEATVHGPSGIVTLGRFVLEPSLAHVWDEAVGARREGARWMFRDQFTGLWLAEADHLQTGNPGNYYHWLLDGIGRWVADPASVRPALVPWSGVAFQRSGVAAIPGLAARCFGVAPHQAVLVGRLHWTASVTAAGTAFHPALRRLAAGMRAGEDGPASIYVTRASAANRPLRNEAEIARLCAARGFRVMELDGVGVGEQAALFAGARRIVAPHGAGLANLVFAGAGARVLELHTDRYVNWCFRRLAATMGLRYGAVVGVGEAGEGWIHQYGWTLDPDQLAIALDDPRFLDEA